MADTLYIQVILPLRLEWEPWYYTTSEVGEGTRVRVSFAGREYSGVVSHVSSGPPSGLRVSPQPITGVETDLDPVLPSEIGFWRFTASYYMCTVGEVFKYVYPPSRDLWARKKPRRKSVSAPVAAFASQLDFPDWGEEEPLLILGGDGSRVRRLAACVLESGRDVLELRPDAPRESYARVRDYSRALRSHEPVHITGSRFCVFLPFTKLGLVIIREEQDRRHKFEGGAPRFNARDAALQLACLHGARAVLTSSLPSLESLLNAHTGKFRLEGGITEPGLKPELIDTSAELRKNGMLGSFSRILAARIEAVLGSSGRVLLLVPWKDTSDVEIEARRLFPSARMRLEVLPAFEETDYSRFALVALLRAEYIFGKNDFRADERLLRLLWKLRGSCASLVVQTDVPAHPVFSLSPEDLLAERKALGLPPYTRLVEIRRKGEPLPVRQYFLPRDASLAERKRTISASLPGGCYADVDPAVR